MLRSQSMPLSVFLSKIQILNSCKTLKNVWKSNNYFFVYYSKNKISKTVMLEPRSQTIPFLFPVFSEEWCGPIQNWPECFQLVRNTFLLCWFWSLSNCMTTLQVRSKIMLIIDHFPGLHLRGEFWSSIRSG